MRRRELLGSVVAAVAVGALPACGGGSNLVLVTGRPIDPALVDHDPLALFPGGVVGLAGADARRLFATSLGADVDAIVRELVPLGPEAGFDARRDVERLTAGFYAMQGLDVCAVVQGRFDASAIERAADARKVMPSGKPIVKTRYAEQTMFTVGNLGFVVLSPRTMLSGNEIGMRRALDRLRYEVGEGPLPVLPRAIPGWMTEHLAAPGAELAFAGDFSSSSAGAAATQAVPFVAGLTRARVVGNLAQPGVNLAGTLSYRDEAAAEAGGQTLRNLSDAGQLVGILATLAYGTTFPPIDVRRSGDDLAFTTSIDEPTARSMLRWLADEAKRSF
jgi:hypothetical protein